MARHTSVLPSNEHKTLIRKSVLSTITTATERSGRTRVRAVGVEVVLFAISKL